MTQQRPPLHRWDLEPRAAVELQTRMSGHVVTEDCLGSLRLVAGADVGLDKHRRSLRAALAVLDFPGLTLQEAAAVSIDPSFPYLPGLLSFREMPAILAALADLRCRPDLIVVDGHGLAHPRRFGLACHLGVWTDIPTIGVAKSRLVGGYEEPGLERGSWRPLVDGEEILGAVLRTRSGVRPVFVSVGHRVSLPTALDIVLQLCPRYRLPETTRWAHRLASGSA